MAGQTSGSPLEPTFQGYVGSTMDALLLFEACLSGNLTHVSRRPHDRERPTLIRSGNVFIYEEHSSGIKRWTDGVAWSPSRILGNFLIYRELDKPFQPGEKKRAMKRNKPESAGALPPPSRRANTERSAQVKEDERAYVGSLVDSYQFKDDGLLKKTISVVYNGVTHHLVSYYGLDHVKSQTLKTPTQIPRLQVQPRGELFRSSNFRAPIDDGELSIMDPTRPYSFPQGIAYAGVPAVSGVPPRSLSFSTQSFVQPQGWGGTQQYAHSPTYDMQSAIPSQVPNYGQQQIVSTYPYEVSPYGQSRPSNYGTMMQSRRHSAIPNTNSAAHMAYSTALVPSGTIAMDHSLSTHPFGDAFNTSTPNATVESASASVGGGYENAGAISQRNGAHGMSVSLPQGTAGFDNQLSNEYGHSMNRLPMSDYVQTSGGAAFGSASNSATPTTISILEITELPSGDEDWGRAESLLPKNEGDY